jgi:hypothetical protein
MVRGDLHLRLSRRDHLGIRPDESLELVIGQFVIGLTID